MKTTVLTIQEIINEIRNTQSIIVYVELKDASRMVANAKGSMTFNGSLYSKVMADRRDANDEVIATFNDKQTNLTELERDLRTLVGKGGISIYRIGNDGKNYIDCEIK